MSARQDNEKDVSNRFPENVKNHQMIVIQDDGLDRHIRFRQPDTINMYFDLITWKGHLCFTGDMGTYVFSRIEDMFQFFRREPGARIDYRYWAEKCLAIDKTDGLTRWSREVFKENVLDYLDGLLTETLEEQLESEVFSIGQSEHEAIEAARTFDFGMGQYMLDDYDFLCMNHQEYSYRFIWCCHALVWAINKYDEEIKKDEVPFG